MLKVHEYSISFDLYKNQFINTRIYFNTNGIKYLPNIFKKAE